MPFSEVYWKQFLDAFIIVHTLYLSISVDNQLL